MSKIHTILGDWPAPEYAWQAEFMPTKCRGLLAVRCYMHCCAALQHRGHNPGLSPRRNTTRAGPSSRQRKQNGHANYYLGATQAPPACSSCGSHRGGMPTELSSLAPLEPVAGAHRDDVVGKVPCKGLPVLRCEGVARTAQSRMAEFMYCHKGA